VMIIYWERRFRERPGFVGLWLGSGLAFGLPLVLVIHDTNLVGKLVGRPLPAQIDPLRRVRGHAEMGRIVSEARTHLSAEGKPVFIIGPHYGLTSLLTFYQPEARRRVQNDPIVFCAPSDRPINQYYFWPGYSGTHTGQNALFVRECDLPKLAKGWFPKWWAGETNLFAPETNIEPAPEWLSRQFDSVTDLGMRDVRVRGRVLHQIQIFECHGLR